MSGGGIYSWFRRPNKQQQQQQNNKKQILLEEEEQLELGITDELVDLIRTFTLDTFNNFPLSDEEGANDEAMRTTFGNVQQDLSDWQERHAVLVLSKVKELAQLRFKLCPRYLKERQFWRVYFTLVKNCLAEFELRAIRLERLKHNAVESRDGSKTACEVEMLESKKPTDLDAATLLDHIV